VPAGQNVAAHRAAVVVEFHFQERRAHPRDLTRTLLRAPKERRPERRYPAQQAKTKDSDRNRDCDLAAKEEKGAEEQRGDAADLAHQACGLLGIGFGECLYRP